MRTRKILGAVAALALVVAGCNPGPAKPKSAGKDGAAQLNVLCSFFPMYVFTKNVVGDRDNVTVSLMLPAEMGCPHDYDLTPADAKKLAAADLFVINGGGLEEFSTKQIQQANAKVTLVDSSTGIKAIAIDEHDHAHDDHDHEHDHDKPAKGKTADLKSSKDHDHDHDHGDKPAKGKVADVKSTKAHDDHDHEHDEDKTAKAKVADAKSSKAHDDHDHDHDHDDKPAKGKVADAKSTKAHDDHDHDHDDKPAKDKVADAKSSKAHDDHDHDHDHDHGDEGHRHHGGVNPHFFSSPLEAAKQVHNIAEALAKADPEGAETYRKNAKEYAAKLEGLAAELTTASAGLKSKKIVTMHEVFDYLARDFGLEIVATIQSTPGHEPSPTEMRSTIGAIKKSGGAAIFTEPQYDKRVADTIAKDAGVKVYELDPIASGPSDAAADYYETKMKQNIDVLKKALGGPSS